MQIGHRWTRMLSNWETYVSHLKHNNSYISQCFFLSFYFCHPSFIHKELRVTVILASCHAICEFIQMRAPCFFCLLVQGWSIHERHFSLSLYNYHPFFSLPSPLLRESCCGIGGTSWALWEAINECVAWRVVMRGILQPFIRVRRHLTGGQPTGCVII